MIIADQCKEGRYHYHDYYPKYEWGEKTMVQWGLNGILINKKEKRVDSVTAFFEAFPREPISCFVRGEGENLEEAEKNAYERYQIYLHCEEHEWDRRGRTDGYAFCKKCELGKKVFDPITTCHICGKKTSWNHELVDGERQYVCQLHDPNQEDIPIKEMTKLSQLIKKGDAEVFHKDTFVETNGKAWEILFVSIKVPIEGAEDSLFPYTFTTIYIWVGDYEIICKRRKDEKEDFEKFFHALFGFDEKKTE